MRAASGLLLPLLPLLACSSSPSSTTTHHGGGFDGGLGGDDGGIASFTGVVPCGQSNDAGIKGGAGQCALSMPVQGGISGTIHVPHIVVSCGSGSNSSAISEIDWATDTGNDTSVSVIVYFENPVSFDETGTFPAHIELGQGSGDGGSVHWQTPAGACSIVIAGSICIGPPLGPDGGSAPMTERILSGTGSCTRPAAPEMGNGAAPVTIGTFDFLESIGP
jgi:hypothetical protein